MSMLTEDARALAVQRLALRTDVKTAQARIEQLDGQLQTSLAELSREMRGYVADGGSAQPPSDHDLIRIRCACAERKSGSWPLCVISSPRSAAN